MARMLGFIFKYVKIASWLAVLLAIFARLSFLSVPLFEYLCSFTVQLFAVLIALFVVLFCLNLRFSDPVLPLQRRLACLPLFALVVAIVISGAPILPLFLDRSARSQAFDGQKRLKLLQFNVLTENKRYEDVAGYISEMSPDLVALEELDQNWVEKMNALLPNYPYRCIVVTPHDWGAAIYSRIEFKKQRTFQNEVEGVKLGSAEVTFDFDGEPLTILCSHPLTPVFDSGLRGRNQQLENLVRERKSGSYVIAADLNCTPFSAAFGKFCRTAALADSENSFGIAPTFLSDSPLLGIRIDHVLISGELRICKQVIGPANGSDHFPLYVELLRARK